MKKFMLFLFILYLSGFLLVQAYDNKKNELDSLAYSALKAAEVHDEVGMNQYMNEMIKLGATGWTDPTILKKRTSQCPPVTIQLNGETLSGELCAKVGYEYNETVYWVGYCK